LKKHIQCRAGGEVRRLAGIEHSEWREAVPTSAQGHLDLLTLSDE